MNRLLLFNPENDIALARNVRAFTPPPAAAALARSGQLLSLWTGREGDAVMCDGVSDEWMRRINDTFDIRAGIWDHDPGSYTPTPWGWSLAARRIFEINGFAVDKLPSDDRLARIRELSHRRTAAKVARILSDRLPMAIWPAAEEVSDPERLTEILSQGDMVVKAPWSSSGRGVTFSTPATASRTVQRTAGTIRSQGSVMVERMADRIADFAMLFTYRDGVCRRAGMSFFMTLPTGEYLGNLVDTPDAVRDTILRYTGAEALDAIASALPEALQEVIGKDYAGPLGVDMLVDRSGLISPVVEINFRYTMGFVARDLARHTAVPSLFSVVRETARAERREPHICDGRLTAGCLRLVPPGTPFTFLITATDQ